MEYLPKYWRKPGVKPVQQLEKIPSWKPNLTEWRNPRAQVNRKRKPCTPNKGNRSKVNPVQQQKRQAAFFQRISRLQTRTWNSTRGKYPVYKRKPDKRWQFFRNIPRQQMNLEWIEFFPREIISKRDCSEDIQKRKREIFSLQLTNWKSTAIFQDTQAKNLEQTTIA